MSKLKNDIVARHILRNAVIRARLHLQFGEGDPMEELDALGEALDKVDGEWPASDIEEAPPLTPVQVDCPECGAVPGQVCRKDDFGQTPSKKSHSARVKEVKCLT